MLAGCNVERDDSGDMLINHGNGSVTATNRSPTWSVETGARGSATGDGKGQVIDLAGALDPQEMQELAQRLAGTQRAEARPLIVVLIQPDGGQSLEQVGWAVGNGPAGDRSTIILVDPRTRQVRLEGDLDPARRAEVAAAMRDGLASGQVYQAITAGIARFEQLEPS